ncbi:MAG: FAD-dependent oxidoreductase [Actinomycetota bacterium]
MSSAPRTDTVCILGAGPQGLAAALHLLEADPGMADRLVVLDPSGDWLATWREHFARLEIGNLRSPVVHHPAPDVSTLARHIARHGLPRTGLPYELPTFEAFTSFCEHLVGDGALPSPTAVRARSVRPVDGRLVVEAGDESMTFDHLIVAANPHRRVLPDWVGALLGHFPQLQHADDVDLRQVERLDGEVVAIVGGGLTAAHLAQGAADRGAHVELIARRPLTIRPFDTDPGWLGPRFLRDYGTLDDPRERLTAAATARGGGTIPPWMADRLARLQAQGRIAVREETSVLDATPGAEGTACLRLRGGVDIDADRVWLATGTVPHLGALRCLGDLAADMGQIDGIPVTDELLRAGPHPVYVMGRLATVQLGPAAGNLWGAQRAASRITRAITGVDLDPGSTAYLPLIRE